MTANTKSVLASGRKLSFCHPRPRPTPRRPPIHGNERLLQLMGPLRNRPKSQRSRPRVFADKASSPGSTGMPAPRRHRPARSFAAAIRRQAGLARPPAGITRSRDLVQSAQAKPRASESRMESFPTPRGLDIVAVSIEYPAQHERHGDLGQFRWLHRDPQFEATCVPF